MLSNYIRPLGRVMGLAAVMSLTACGGGGGTSLTQSKPPSITLSATSYSLQVQNTGYVYPDQSSLSNARIMATAVDNKGNTVPSGQITFTVSGGQTSVGALYESDFKTKVTDSNGVEHPAAFWGLPVDISGGMAQCVFQAHTQTGTANIVATYTDANGQSTQQTIQINVVSPVNTGLPTSIFTSIAGLPTYVAGQQGRNSQSTVSIGLYDPANQAIASNGSNNIKAQIIGGDLGGAMLVGAGGQTGQTVNTTLTGSSGLAQISVNSGTESGLLSIQLTADGADNNVDNGIQKPVVKDITIPISDGRVASLSFGGPFINAIKNNQSSATLATGDAIDQGTYSRAISVVVQDANGNPVPNSVVRFGLIDSPLTAGSYPDPGFSPALPTGSSGPSVTFAIQGSKGNPVEGGNQFTEADGVNLVTKGVRGLDRLILVPDEQGTQRDTLGSRIIANLIPGSSTGVTTTSNFLNPVTPGYIDGNNIPWVIGRAQYGNIGTTATTDSNGVATTFITYPVSRLNQPAILTAEADDGVSSVFGAYYVGVAGGTLTSSVTSVSAGSSTSVTMCATDANNVPLPGENIQAGLSDGATISGSTTTGANGCASFTLNTTGVPPGTAQFDIPFTVGTGANQTVKISVAAAQTAANIALTISGATVTDPTHNARTVTAIVTDTNGNPVPGQTVVFSFPAPTDDGSAPSAAITNPSSGTASVTTDSAGKAAITVDYTGNVGDTYSATATAGANSATQPFPY
ncbi:MAG: hypothetical protein B7X37_07410 [Halothiobacillus sp. 14-55-98]|nr:MAG: hypothetical protein B7X37_07410 [Halothiobacillus sp. 14-55-98]